MKSNYSKKNYIERESLTYENTNIILLNIPTERRQEAINIAKNRIDKRFTWPLIANIYPENKFGFTLQLSTHWDNFEPDEEDKDKYDIYKIPMDNHMVTILLEKDVNRPKFTKTLLNQIKDFWYETIAIQYDEKTDELYITW